MTDWSKMHDVTAPDNTGISMACQIQPSLLAQNDNIPIHIEITQEKYKKLKKLLYDGLQTEGAHHKQWCLREIAKTLGIDVEDLGHEEGIKP